ncbi:MAG: phosphate acyltransferase PlsX [Pseudomonadota bacterium]|nr:phosphate acyltransferase PlsX [Pseudomonadota bacterium]
MEYITIAIDAMGGDYGLAVTVPAALQAVAQHPNLRLILVGDSIPLSHALTQHPPTDRIRIETSTQVVAMDDPPSVALRAKRDSSMRVAINLVKEGQAQACVSAGNTGALMAIARFVLKMIPGVDRPAIIATLPTVTTDKVVRILDLGANVESSADHLFQFAVMGSLLSAAIDGIAEPRVALLNIGAEEIKGNEQVKETAQRLTDCPVINYVGYIEGDELFSGDADVIVCDGFVGNVALKTLEGTAKLFMHYTRLSFQKNIWMKIAGLFSRPAFNDIKYAMDPGRRNGASLLGLRGIVIKSHGSADVVAYTHAINQAIMQVRENVIMKIEKQAELLLTPNE